MRYKRKIDVLFWWIVALLPAFIVAIGCINHDIIESFTAISGLFFDTSLTDMIYSFFETIHYTGESTMLISGFVAYFIIVLFAHMIFDILVLIPRWLMNTIDYIGDDKNV